MRRIIAGTLAGALASLVALVAPSAQAADEVFTLRASVDTSAAHTRTISIADYLKKLEAASNGRIKTELFHSGQLFRDRDVMKALRQGGVEMAAPGTWIITGFVPDTDAFQLPVFFGRDLPFVRKAIDGKIGATINAEMERRLASKVIGPWLPLGYQNTYSTSKPLKSFEDLAGMKIRNPGGAGLSIRAKFFNAQPNVTPWPDVPLALSQGTFDAVSSTDESLASAKLWESGIKYGFSMHEYVGSYVPLISDSFYKKLPPDLQKLVVDTWAQNIPEYRKNMEHAQLEARKTLEKNGVVFTDPSPEQLAAVRAKMMPTSDAVAKELSISKDVMNVIKAEIPADQ